MRLTVRGQHGLLVVLVQLVERVKGLVLCALLAGEELDVVDQPHIDTVAAVAAELISVDPGS